MKFFTALAFTALAAAQQYAGDIISANLPTIAGAEVAFFKIPDTTGTNSALTLINYYSHRSDGSRIVESDIKRVVINIHGLQRDPWNYETDMLNALKVATAKDANINPDTVAVIAPYFPSGADKTFGYPWTDGLAAGEGSTTNALVWDGSQWSGGANNVYPHNSRNTSSFFVLDTLVKYFDDATLFPNLNQIVVAGHSMGAQMVQRYAAVSPYHETRVPVTHWIGNPDSYAWLSDYRPLTTVACADFDDWRSGLSNYDSYADGMTYSTYLVQQGREAVLANYQSKQIAYARGLLDHGDHSTGCAPTVTGADRHERFFFFIKDFAPSCPDSKGRNCDTVDFVEAEHDNGQMYNSDAGQARLFTDNFYGLHGRAYDFGYPRLQAGDDPFPNPDLESTPMALNQNTYGNGFTYQGCWTNQAPTTVEAMETLLFSNSSNTIEFCTNACSNAGWKIAAMGNGNNCWCGNEMRSASAVATVDSACRLACAGESTEICGAKNRLSVFSSGELNFV